MTWNDKTVKFHYIITADMVEFGIRYFIPVQRILWIIGFFCFFLLLRFTTAIFRVLLILPSILNRRTAYIIENFISTVTALSLRIQSEKLKGASIHWARVSISTLTSLEVVCIKLLPPLATQDVGRALRPGVPHN